MGILNLPTNSYEYATYAWANRPTIARQDDLIIITDIGASDEMFRWTGSRWAPLNGCVTLAQSNTKIDYTGSTGTLVLATVTIPAKLMSTNGALEILTLWTYTNSANAKTITIRFSGPSGTAFFTRSEASTQTHQVNTIIRNVNSVSSQVGTSSSTSGSFGSSSGSLITSSVDTTVDTSLSISGNLSNSTETITLQSYRVIYRE